MRHSRLSTFAFIAVALFILGTILVMASVNRGPPIDYPGRPAWWPKAPGWVPEETLERTARAFMWPIGNPVGEASWSFLEAQLRRSWVRGDIRREAIYRPGGRWYYEAFFASIAIAAAANGILWAAVIAGAWQIVRRRRQATH